MIMSLRRALVDCVVLSLQDSPVFYPCCKECFSKITVQQQDRCRCFRCGYSCTAALVGYRYRLSLNVARDGCLFGLTVFGTCLNPFFGIGASGLQRLVVNLDEPAGTSMRSMLLMKAVQDCFIGRHFIFGIKLNETEPQPWIKGAVQNGSDNKDKAHVIASQMILPKATGLEGCTVIRYYQSLLQKAVESEPGSSDPRLPPASLFMTPHYSPGRTFENDAQWSSSRLSDSARSSQHPDSTFTHTPPWQHSLGLVTSSAEQEEDGYNQDIGDEDDSQAERFNSSHLEKGNCPKDQEDSEETALSPLSLEHGSYDQLMLDRYSVIQTLLGNTPVVKVSPGSPGHSSTAKWLSTKEMLMSGSVAWEDLPFSESLTEFCCEKQGCDIPEPQRNAHNKRETPRILPEISPQDKILSIQSSRASKGDHLQALMDISNTPAGIEADGCDCSEQVWKNHLTSANNRRSDGCNQDNEEEEETCEVEVYNCSADLFSNPLTFDTVTETPNRTVRSIPKRRLLISRTPRLSEQANISHVTPNKHRLKHKNDDDGDYLRPPELDFIPPSQCSPIMRAGSPASYRCSTAVGPRSLPDYQESSDLARRTPAKISPSLCKWKPLVRSLHRCEKNRFTLKRQPEMTKRDLLPLQHLKVQRAAPYLAPTEKGNNRCDTSSADGTACGGVNEMLIPPTPPAKTQPRQTARKQNSTPLCEPTRNQDSEAGVGGSLGASPCDLLDESKECDWSRDLFSDSL